MTRASEEPAIVTGLYANGKARFRTTGDPRFAHEVAEAFAKAARLRAYLDEEVFGAVLRKAGVPSDAIARYLETCDVDDETYLSPRHA